MATVILSVGLPPLISAMAEGAMQSRTPINATIASFLVTERFEQITARRYRSSAGYGEVTVANFPAETPVTGFNGFTRSVAISELDAALNPSGAAVGYRKVVVTVTWDGGAGSIALGRLFADY